MKDFFGGLAVVAAITGGFFILAVGYVIGLGIVMLIELLDILLKRIRR